MKEHAANYLLEQVFHFLFLYGYGDCMVFWIKKGGLEDAVTKTPTRPVLLWFNFILTKIILISK